MPTVNQLHQLLGHPSIPRDRMRGTTTGLALKYIADAILRPGVASVVIDHVPGKATTLRLRATIEAIIAKLDLQFITVKPGPGGEFYITFDLYKDVLAPGRIELPDTKQLVGMTANDMADARKDLLASMKKNVEQMGKLTEARIEEKLRDLDAQRDTKGA